MAWIKAFHIIFMVTWFAGLFYLPRLFVYHSDPELAESARARFAVMERRLFRLMTIGGAATVALGLWLLLAWFWPPPLWLRIKLVLVAGLIGYHAYLGYLIRDLHRQPTRRPPRFYRWLNELPSLFLIAIILLAVLRPDSWR
jgi:putative membrane protein